MSFFLPFIPLYLKDLGMTDQAAISTWSGVLFASGFVMLSLTAPMWGVMADRWGRKIMVIRSMGAASIVLFLTSFVQTPTQLLGLRLLHGSLSGFVSAAIAMIASESPKKSLGLSLGLFQSSITGGFILGPALGGFLRDSYGLRASIQWGGAMIFIGTLLVWFFVREKNKPEPSNKRHSIRENISFLYNSSSLWPAARIQFFSNMSLMAVQPVMALFVLFLTQSAPERAGFLTGMALSVTAFSMMIGAPLWGKIGDSLGQTKILTICLFGAGFMFLPQGLSGNMTHLLVSRFILGFFASGIAPAIQALIAHNTPDNRRAGILGVSFSMTLFGNALGPLIGGALGAHLGLRSPFFFTMILLIVAAFLARNLKEEKVKVIAPVSSDIA